MLVDSISEPWGRNTPPVWQLHDVSPHVIIKLKHLFPRINSGARNSSFYFDDHLDVAVDLDWFLQRYPMEISSSVKKRLKSKCKAYHAEQEACLSFGREEYEPPERVGIKHPHSLRYHQSHSVSVVEVVKRAITVDDVGMGKSFTAAGMALLPDALPFVLVCEPHLQDQFYNRISDFLDLRVGKLGSMRPKKDETGKHETISNEVDVLIVKYNQLPHWVSQLLDFK